MISPITVKLPDLTTSETILPKVATGEPRAMSSCISKYGAMVWLITKGYVNNATEAEDLVQEIFTEVWKKAATFDPKIAAESTFIGLIARRRSIDFLRREGRKPSFEPLTVVDAFLQPTNEDTATIHDPDIVQSSVANLPPETRQLFQLFFDHGLTHPEIAEKTGLPLGTIKTRLRRGLMSIRENLIHAENSNIQAAP